MGGNVTVRILFIKCTDFHYVGKVKEQGRNHKELNMETEKSCSCSDNSACNRTRANMKMWKCG